MTIENEKRFEEAEYLLKPFQGNVFPDLNGLTAFLKSLEIEQSVLSRITESIASGATAGVAAGSAVFIAQQASLSLLSGIAVALGLVSIPLTAPLAAGSAVAVAVGSIVHKSNSKKKTRNDSYEDYVATWDMNDYGRRVAEIIFPPVIRFMRTSGSWSPIKQGALSAYVKDLHGFSDEFLLYWTDIAENTSIEKLDRHIKQMQAILESGNHIPLMSNDNLYKKADKLIDLYSRKVVFEYEHRELTKEEKSYKDNWNKTDELLKALIEVEKAENSLKKAKDKVSIAVVKQYISQQKSKKVTS